MRVNNVAAIFVSILIFVASIAAVLFINLWEFSSKQDKNQVQYGVLDLSEESNIKLTNLNGSWEFYPGVFIDSPSESPIKPRYANVPGSLINMREAQVGGGYAGTYRLVVKVPAQGAYGIKTGSIRTACRTFINGEEAFVIGKPSVNKGEHEHGSRYETAFAHEINGEIEMPAW